MLTPASQAQWSQPETELLPKYCVHGVSIASDFALPELASMALADTAGAEVEIGFGRVPCDLPDASETDEGFLVNADAALLDTGEGVTFLVERGVTITVEQGHTADPDLMRLYLYGAAFSVLLQQRGLMALHASAAVVGSGALAFAGASQQGKSTLAAMLSQMGHAAISDDKLVVEPRADGTCAAFPGPPALSLFEDAAAACGQSRMARASELKKFGKHTYLVPELYAKGAVPLLALCFLDWSAGGVGVRRLAPFEALVLLRQNMNMPSLISLLGHEQEFLAWAEALLDRMPAYLVTRPKDRARIRETAEDIVAAVVRHHSVAPRYVA